MQLFWRKYDKTERDGRRKAERAANEQRKAEEELKEAKRQQRKFNFLITQTELYAHFMHSKLTNGLYSGLRNTILCRSADACVHFAV